MRYKVYEVQTVGDNLVLEGDDGDRVEAPMKRMYGGRSVGYDFRRAFQRVLNILADRGERVIPEIPWPFEGKQSMLITEKATEKADDPYESDIGTIVGAQ